MGREGAQAGLLKVAEHEGFCRKSSVESEPTTRNKKAEDDCTSEVLQISLEIKTLQSHIFSQLRSIWTKHHASLCFATFTVRNL